MDLVGTEVGARCVCERNDDEIWLGENPRTTLCEVISSALVSEPTVCIAPRSLSGLLRGLVDDEESEKRSGACVVGDAARGVIFVDGNVAGTASAIEGDNGSNSFFSLMLNIIFSNPSEVMCFSVPLLVLLIDSVLRVGDDLMSTGSVRN